MILEDGMTYLNDFVGRNRSATHGLHTEAKRDVVELFGGDEVFKSNMHV